MEIPVLFEVESRDFMRLLLFILSVAILQPTNSFHDVDTTLTTYYTHGYFSMDSHSKKIKGHFEVYS